MGTPSPTEERHRQRNYADTTWWDPYVETIADEDTYLRRKFRQDVTDRSTGLSQEALPARLAQIVADGKASSENWRVTKAKCFAAQVLEESIGISPLDWFPAIAVWNRWRRPISKVISDRAGEVNAAQLPEWVRSEWAKGNADGIWNMWQDFDHSVPDWRVILKLGFPGMRARLEKYAVAGDPFYDGLRITADAILEGIDRFIAQGKKNLAQRPQSSQSHTGNEQTDLLTPNGVRDNVSRVSGEQIRVIGNDPSRTLRTSREKRLAKQIACLERLRSGAPQTAYDMLMFVWLYFLFSEHLDGIQCRSLTELDVFLTPYYEADLAAGRTTEAEFREQMKHFLWQWGSIANYWNQPVGLGGTKPDGTTEFNHVSKIILDVMDECALATPKFLAKVADNTPDWAWDKMLDMARRHRSIAFIGEEPAARALKTGATPDGRKAGEEMSKNLSPTMGADTEGATALVLTLAASSVETLPGDYPLDMMLHPSVCAGDDGLKAMRTLVKLFHKNGGSVIQFTVFSAEELRDAQAHPEKYENLQVRVCGWNVRWNDLARSEQDAYIRRAENVALSC